ncbi:hypothetical protein BBP40_012615 [Aspergillus hancockii]|nr:hypothetical protein BBP40_012615 [Aspergillus hancockii]
MHLGLASIATLFLATAGAIRITKPANGDIVDVCKDWQVCWTYVKYVWITFYLNFSSIIELADDYCLARIPLHFACISPTLWITLRKYSPSWGFPGKRGALLSLVDVIRVYEPVLTGYELQYVETQTLSMLSLEISVPNSHAARLLFSKTMSENVVQLQI